MSRSQLNHAHFLWPLLDQSYLGEEVLREVQGQKLVVMYYEPQRERL